MKKIIKDVLNKHPYPFKANRLVHEIERYRAYRKVRLRPSLTTRPDLLEVLDRDGIVVIPGYVAPDVVAKWVKDVDVLIAKIRAGKLSQFVFQKAGLEFCRIAWADSLVPDSGTFFEDPMVSGLARAYLSPDVASYRREIDFKAGPAPFGAAELFHFDNWRPTIKAFLYLTEVTEETAPFVYAAGTHKLAPWRTRYDIEFDVHNPLGRNGHFFPQEIDRLKKEIRFEERTYTGSAGTLIFADFRGLHRATPLKVGCRIMLNNTFGLMDSPLGPPPPIDV